MSLVPMKLQCSLALKSKMFSSASGFVLESDWFDFSTRVDLEKITTNTTVTFIAFKLKGIL